MFLAIYLVTQFDGCLTIEADTFSVLGKGLSVLALNVLKNHVRFRNFFLGLALTTFLRR